MIYSSSRFSHFAKWTAQATGHPAAFIIAALIIIVWGVTGPIFKFSDTWQLIINTGTTIITFLMVFLIQKTQNKDALAIQIKLDELVSADDKASNRIVSIEDLTEEELIHLHEHYTHLAEITKKRLSSKSKK